MAHSGKVCWYFADLVQYVADFYHTFSFNNDRVFTLTRFDDAISTHAGPPEEFGFPVLRGRFTDPVSGLYESDRYFYWFRPDRLQYNLTEADLLKERPWYQSISRPYNDDANLGDFLFQFIPTMAEVIADLYQCQITTEITVRDMPYAGALTLVKFYVGADTSGHVCACYGWQEGVFENSIGFSCNGTTEFMPPDSTRDFLDFDQRAGILTNRVSETDRGDGTGGGGDDDDDTGPVVAVLEEIRDEIHRVSDQRTTISLNNGGSLYSVQPAEVIESGE